MTLLNCPRPDTRRHRITTDLLVRSRIRGDKPIERSMEEWMNDQLNVCVTDPVGKTHRIRSEEIVEGNSFS